MVESSIGGTSQAQAALQAYRSPHFQTGNPQMKKQRNLEVNTKYCQAKAVVFNNGCDPGRECSSAACLPATPSNRPSNLASGANLSSAGTNIKSIGGGCSNASPVKTQQTKTRTKSNYPKSKRSKQRFDRLDSSAANANKYERPSSAQLRETHKKLIFELPAPYVSSTHWCILNKKNNELLFGKRETETRQVASLTKIMTSLVVLELLEQCEGVSPHIGQGKLIKIPFSASQLCGTSANLLADDMLTVEQLMFGMMLPSGNDAAQSLALYFGSFMATNGKVDPNEYLHQVSDQAVEDRFQELLQAEKEAKEREKQKKLKKQKLQTQTSQSSLEKQSDMNNTQQSPFFSQKEQIKIQEFDDIKDSEDTLTTNRQQPNLLSLEHQSHQARDPSSSATSGGDTLDIEKSTNNSLNVSSKQQTGGQMIDKLSGEENNSTYSKKESTSSYREENATANGEIIQQEKEVNTFREENQSDDRNDEDEDSDSMDSSFDSNCSLNSNTQEQTPEQEMMHKKTISFQSVLSQLQLPEYQYWHIKTDSALHDQQITGNNCTKIKKSALPALIKQEREARSLKAFLDKMNETAERLNMKKSRFSVCHGMHHQDNWSSALDMAQLSRHVLSRFTLFRDVVDCKRYTAVSRIEPDHTYVWENTNFLLWDDSKCYHGVKTGVTPTAGPCLSVHYRSKDCAFDFIVVILNAKTKEARFVEIPRLIEWAQQKILRVRSFNWKPSIKKQLLRNLQHF